MAHLTDKQIAKTWAKRDNAEGVWIGEDLLIKGENVADAVAFFGFDFDEIDWESECIEFNAEDYYIICGLEDRGTYTAIHEVSCEGDIALRYFYD